MDRDRGTDVTQLFSMCLRIRAWRHQGVAQLPDGKQIIDWSRAENLDRLVLHASDAGRTLYEGLGFTTTNEMRFHRRLKL